MSTQYLEKYLNPENTEEIMRQISQATTLEGIKEIIILTFPDLIQEYTRGYSEDYPFLIKNWHTMCQAMKVQPKGLILVEFVPPSIRDLGSEKYSLLRKMFDIMTANGFVARRKEEFRLCEKCKLAIPCFELHKLLKFRQPDGVPKEWDFICSNCEI